MTLSMRQKGFDFGGEGPPRGSGRPTPQERSAEAGRPGAARAEAKPPATRAERPAAETSRGSASGRDRRAMTVSELTDRIQGILETELFDVWVEGEISNLKLAPSGHHYFSLKDDEAQIRAVVWRNDARLLRFRPKDGMKVLARGQLRVFPPRGEYQLQVQVLEPLGKGSLQQAFEELKEKLQQEGLFDPARKRPLPMLPRRIGVVTSPGGAVLRDILRVLRSRYANLDVLVYPVAVQGDGAWYEIAQAIRGLNRLPGLDVIVLARGGGSLEDLWAFNEEGVARAIAASRIPTISAVGHETDFTIADFVADLRAATPSAAAERVVQAKEELQARVRALDGRRDGALRLRLARVRARVEAAAAHRVFAAERGRLRVLAQRTDELVRRAEGGLVRGVERGRAHARRLRERLEAFRLDRQLQARRERLARHGDRLAALARGETERRRARLGRLAASLDGLSPLSVLGRGYALVWRDGTLVRRAGEVEPGERLRIRLHEGTLRATVDSRETE
jgi:exodeoxyribonuclease VII large subunit